MLLSRCRSVAAVLVLLLAFALVVPPAAAAPIAPAAGSWWSALAAGFDGLLGFFGWGGGDAVGAASETEPDPVPPPVEEGPGLEPDGDKLVVGPDGGDSVGSSMDPNG